jgi:4-amino-4-deoxy-L-arabinose transferase-like glycosyltransferase
VPTSLTRLPALLAAAVLLVFGFLPLANWIPGGHAANWYHLVLDGWVSGGAIALGGGVVLAILSRRLPALWRDGLTRSPVAWWERDPARAEWVIAGMAFAAYLIIAWFVFSGRPLLIDEGVQLLQARMYAAGHLWVPTDPHPEFTSSMHVIDTGGKVYSQFPPGGPAMLLPGVWLGLPWIVGPACGALTVVCFAGLVRRMEPDAATSLGATLLYAFAPFVAFMSGSHMNHVTAMLWILLALLALARLTGESRAPAGWALALGLGFGVAATIRPVDAFAFALPAGLWVLRLAIRDRSWWPKVGLAGVGVLLPIAAMGWVNLHTTGAPLRFGYEVLWGKVHELGFHAAPWGMTHTPLRGIELVNLYFLRLQTYLFETPFPSLLPAIVALLLARRMEPLDRYLLISSAIVVGFYFAYWHDGFYLGPRFFYPLAPVLALWSGRALPSLRARWANRLGYRTSVYAAVIGGGMAAAILIPLRAEQYRNGLASMRWDQKGAAARAGVENALVFVRESWGAQLVARMWALGISRTQTELLYRYVDACALERALPPLEAEAVRTDSAFQALRPLLRDSSRVISSPFSTDTTEKVLPGSTYPAVCLKRMAEDQSGFTVLTPMLLSDGGGNLYVRDLHARDSLLIARYPDRPVWLLKPDSPRIGAAPEFHRVSLDSARAEWETGRER